MKIDVHAHFVPERCREIPGPQPDQSSMEGDITDLGKRVRDMDAMGVDMQALSPWMGFLNRDLAIARQTNDGIAEAMDRHPGRFLGLAAVPMSSPEEAAAEVERAVKDLGLHGVGIGTNVGGTNLDAKEFAPFYAKAQELDVPIFIHPVDVLGVDRLKSYYLVLLLGVPTDTAVAVASLIFGGVLKEFPRLKFYLAHGGGSCPYIMGRWEQGWRVRPETRVHIDRPPSEYFKRFHFDTMLQSTAALNFLVESVGVERVLMGTDYPFDLGDHHPVDSVTAVPHLSDGQREQIFSGNAAALFKLDA